MRIISGSKKSHSISAPRNLPIRPTTDFCKESLFNILENNFNIDRLKVLDLFSGSGSISLEFASRGCQDITAVDNHYGCYRFIRSESTKLGFDCIRVVKKDALSFLIKENAQYDIIFADPPYKFKDHTKLVETIFEKELLKPQGWAILEHAAETKIQNDWIQDQRKYGQSKLSFFYK